MSTDKHAGARTTTADLERIFAPLGGEAAARELLERGRADEEYVGRERSELLRRYPEHWVAVADGQVVDADRNIDHLADRLWASGLLPGHVVVTFMTDQQPIHIYQDGGSR